MSFHQNSNAYSSPRTLGILAVVALAGVSAAELLSAGTGVVQVLTPDLSFSLGHESQSVWHLIQGLIAIVSLPLRMCAIVFFLVWLNRANKNMEPLMARTTEFTSGWAVGWWFVPFANLVKPFQVVREVWWESNPVIDDEPIFLSESLRSAPTYMGFWWAFWLISNFASNVSGSFFDPDDPDAVVTSGILFVISGVLTAVAGVLAAWVVWDITRRQDLRIETVRMRFFRS